MTKKPSLFAMLLIAVTGLSLAAETVEGLPLHVKALAPGVVRVWVGDYVSSTAICAIATQKGIVVIDSTDIPKLDQAFRKVIARELGRSDFKYLINTHGHGDHTNGNGVYADCEIIAHEAVPDMMRANIRDIPRLIAWYQEYIPQQKAEIASGKLTAEQKAALEERLAIEALTLEYLGASPRPTLPTKTFRDKLVLDCGDVTFELFQSGGTHTRSDIFVLVPQKGILFTGDTMADKWLTDTPGCLATFAIRTGEAIDFPVLVKNWQALLDRQNEIQMYVPGHWNGELSSKGFQDRFQYLKTMLTDIEALAKTGDDSSLFSAGTSLKGKFPHLVGSPGMTDQGHWMSVSHLYTIFSGKIPVADTLQGLFENPGTFVAEFNKLKAEILKSREKYFYPESQLNGIGYFLLQQQKEVAAAIMLFEFNAELHPASWNAYDSLAEAHYTKGDKQKALELYRKSLELNPASENGKKFIELIEQELKK